MFQSTRLIYSRWQVQCKNTSRAALDDVAKEVGLTAFIKSNVIVIVTTGTIGGEARRYANEIMRDSNLAIVMLDGPDLHRITTNAAQIADVFHREAQAAMKLKHLDLGIRPIRSHCSAITRLASGGSCAVTPCHCCGGCGQTPLI